MKKLLLILICLLPACATPNAQHFFEPSEGMTIKKEVGETLVEEGWGMVKDCSFLTTKKEYIIEGSSWFHKYKAVVPVGNFTRAKISYYQKFYMLPIEIPVIRTSKISKNETIHNVKIGINYPKNREPYFVVFGLNTNLSLREKKRAISYNKTSKFCYDPYPSYLLAQGYNRQLIYNGGTNKVIKITYREFYNTNAKDAFTQDMTYDLNQSDIIGFRGVRLKVLAADNVSIQYVILKHFDHFM